MIDNSDYINCLKFMKKFIVMTLRRTEPVLRKLETWAIKNP